MSDKLTLKGSIWHNMDPETVKAHGPWVRHSDYAQLERDLAEARTIELEHQETIRHLKAERDRLAAALEGEGLEKALISAMTPDGVVWTEYLEALTEIDCKALGLTWPDHPFDRHADVRERQLELFAKVLAAAARASLQTGEPTP